MCNSFNDAYLYPKQNFNEKLLDYNIVTNHIKSLEVFSSIKGGSYFIKDYFLKKILYYKSNKLNPGNISDEEIMDKGFETIFKFMHPEDIISLINISKFCHNFITTVPIDERKNYKLNMEFRIYHNNKYIRIFHQFVILELDPIGNIWLGLGVNDLSPNPDIDAPLYYCLSKISDNKNYLLKKNNMEFYFADINDNNVSNIKLTKREIEILTLASQGYCTKEIADKLFISLNTVNNHRKNILDKTKTNNITQAFNLALSFGLL